MSNLNGRRKALNHAFQTELKRNSIWQKAQQTQQIDLSGPHTEALRIIQRLVSAPARVLDVGAGPGFLVQGLLHNHYEAYGCDVAPAAVEFAKSVNVQQAHRFFVLDIETQTPKAKPFDVIVVQDLLGQVDHPEAVLARLWTYLADDGFLVISCPKGPRPHRAHHWDCESEFVQLLKAPLDGTQGYPSAYKQYRVEHSDEEFFIGHLKKTPLLLRYALVVGTDAEEAAANDVIYDKPRVKTGVFNWAKLFEGSAHTLDSLGDPTQYDVLHVQLSGTNFAVPSELRRWLGPESPTKLVILCDYAPQYWYMYPPFPELLLNALRAADYICAVEPTSAHLISSLLDGRKCYVIPHPTDLSRIGQFAVPKEQRSRTALVMTHRDNEDSLPYWMLRGSGLITQLFGRMAPLGNPTGQQVDYPALLYNQIHQGYLGNQQLIKEFMAKAFLGVDSYTHHVCGRSALEFAALGVPCIGYENVWAQGHCFPELTVPTGRADLGRELVQRLVSDADFYEKVSTHAQQAVSFFGWEIARRRFLQMLEIDDATALDHQGPQGSLLGETPAPVRCATEPAVGQPQEPVGGHAHHPAAG